MMDTRTPQKIDGYDVDPITGSMKLGCYYWEVSKDGKKLGYLEEAGIPPIVKGYDYSNFEIVDELPIYFFTELRRGVELIDQFYNNLIRIDNRIVIKIGCFDNYIMSNYKVVDEHKDTIGHLYLVRGGDRPSKNRFLASTSDPRSYMPQNCIEIRCEGIEEFTPSNVEEYLDVGINVLQVEYCKSLLDKVLL